MAGVAFAAAIGAGAARADMIPCTEVALDGPQRAELLAVARAKVPRGSPARAVRVHACRVMQAPLRATVTFARFAEQDHEFRQVRIGCDSAPAASWSCQSSEAARHVFSKRHSESVVAVEDISLRDALAVIEFAQTIPLWRELELSRPVLTRAGRVFELRELGATLRIELRMSGPHLLSAERNIL